MNFTIRPWLSTLLLGFGLLASFQLSAEVPTDAKLVRPLPVGSKLPDFTVRTAEGEAYRVSAASLKAPLLMIFYRGGWCPYCNAHLAELRTVEPKLRDMGFDVLFMSADRPEKLRSSLKEPDIGYTLLSDSRMEAARALGIAFKLDDATLKRYKEYGVDMEATSGEAHHELPVPAVFIVDRGGTIRYVYFDPDYRVRMKGDELLKAAQGVVGGSKKAS